MADDLRELPSFERVAEALEGVFAEHFNREAGDMRIKRVTRAPPENISEWPWMFWTADEGDVDLMTFAETLQDVPRRRIKRTFGAEPVSTTRRPKLEVTHRFKGQLFVKPRQDLSKDEAACRPFIEPVMILMAENNTLGGLVKRCFVTGYKYGILKFGALDERAREFIGIDFAFEAVVIL